MLLRLVFSLLFSFTLAAEQPFSLPPLKELSRLRSAVITTNKGDLILQLFPQKAPWHVANFKFLADKKFYDGLRFHIFQPEYLIQAGTPNEHPAGGPSYTLPPEFNDLKHELGAISMVRKPDYLDFDHSRNSHGSQFRIMLTKSEHMDGQYVVFGKVVKGLKVLKSLGKNDKIISLKVFVARAESAATQFPSN